jgi:hypothetical protein
LCQRTAGRSATGAKRERSRYHGSFFDEEVNVVVRCNSKKAAAAVCNIGVKGKNCGSWELGWRHRCGIGSEKAAVRKKR